jgi:hypothetical protein
MCIVNTSISSKNTFISNRFCGNSYTFKFQINLILRRFIHIQISYQIDFGFRTYNKPINKFHIPNWGRWFWMLKFKLERMKMNLNVEIQAWEIEDKSEGWTKLGRLNNEIEDELEAWGFRDWTNLKMNIKGIRDGTNLKMNIKGIRDWTNLKLEDESVACGFRDWTKFEDESEAWRQVESEVWRRTKLCACVGFAQEICEIQYEKRGKACNFVAGI